MSRKTPRPRKSRKASKSSRSQTTSRTTTQRRKPPRQARLKRTCALVSIRLYPSVVATLFPRHEPYAILMLAISDHKPGDKLTSGLLARQTGIHLHTCRDLCARAVEHTMLTVMYTDKHPDSVIYTVNASMVFTATSRSNAKVCTIKTRTSNPNPASPCVCVCVCVLIHGVCGLRQGMSL